jgi:DNA-binding NarL/FixJ family response regulator
MDVEPPRRPAALPAGAAGYLLKDVSSETLVAAIHAAARGESFLQSTVTGKVVAAFTRLMTSDRARPEALLVPLSPREREILALVATGASNKEVADQLCLAEGTVKNHVTNILAKLDVRDRTQAALRARELGIGWSRSRCAARSCSAWAAWQRSRR